MRNLTIVAGLVLALTGCGKNKFDQAVSDMEGLKDKMCACTDQKCFDDVEAESKDFEKTLRDKYKKPEDAPKDLMEVAMAFKECRRDLRHKLHDGASPGEATKPADPAKP